MHAFGQCPPWVSVAVRAFLCAVIATLALPCGAQPVAGQPELLLQYGHTEEIVGTPSISADGTIAATIDGGREIIVWDLENGRQLRRLKPVLEVAGLDPKKPETGSRTEIYSKTTISPDGRLLAASGHGGATIWELKSGRRTAVIATAGRFFPRAPGDLAFSPDSRLLYMPGTAGDVIPYDVTTGTALRQPARLADDFLKNYGYAEALAISADGRLLAAAGRTLVYGTNEVPGKERHWAKIFDSASGMELAMLEHVVRRLERRGVEPKASSYAVAVAISPDGKMLALGGEGAVWIHETGTGRELRHLELKDDVAAGVAFSPDGRLLAVSGSRNYAVRIFDPGTGQQLKELANPRTIEPDVTPTVGGYSKVVFTPDGRSIVATSSRGSLRIWDTVSGETTRFLGGMTDGIFSLTASRDGKRLAVAGQIGNMIRVWNLETGSQNATVSVHAGRINGVVFAPDGRHGVSWSATGEVRLWDSETGAELRRFDHRDADKSKAWDQSKCGKLLAVSTYQDNVIGAAISADGRYLATSGLDCTLRVWDVESGREIRRIDGVFHVVALSNDGRWVVARFRDTGHPLRVWEVSSGKEMSPIKDAQAHILLFNGKNHLLFSGQDQRGGGKPVIAWDIEQEREVERFPVVGSYTKPAWSFDGRRLAVMDLHTKVGEAPVHILDIESGKRTDPPPSSSRGGRPRDVAIIPGGCCMAIGGDTGEVRILDHRSGELLATMVSVRDDGDWLAEAAKTGKWWSGNDWMVVTPDGLFDGPPSSFNKLLWRFSDQLQDIAQGEAFFNEFYRPGLLADIMAGGRPKAPRNIADLDRRQPRIELSAPGTTGQVSRRTVLVKLKVSEAAPDGVRREGSGARDVRLFRNGALVRAWRGDVLVKGAAKELEANVAIVAGENRFTAYSFNRDNVKSADAMLSVQGGANLKRSGTAWVLAIGVNRYANSGFDLNYSVADAEAFSSEVAGAHTALGAYQRVQTAILRDHEASKANIVAALRRLAGQEIGPPAKDQPAALAQLGPAQPEDAVFIFFAGHGLAVEPRFYLVPHDLGYAGIPDKMSAEDFKTLLSRSISDVELEQLLERLDAGRLVMVIDACHSGQALEAEEKRRGPMNSRGLAQLAYEKGMYVLTASQSHQAALEFDQLGHGLLTYALVSEGLGESRADRRPQDGRIEVREWLDYASARVPQLQMDAMRVSAQRGRNVSVVKGDESVADILRRSLQQPRVFYRREAERVPFVIGPARK